MTGKLGMLPISLILLTNSVALFALEYKVRYGVVEQSEELDSGFFEADRYGYTIRVVNDGELIRVDSKVADLLIGDCVALDTHPNETRIRRVQNIECETTLQSIEVEGAPTRDSVREVDMPAEAGGNIDDPRLADCEEAMEKMRDAKTVASRLEARKKAAKVCRS